MMYKIGLVVAVGLVFALIQLPLHWPSVHFLAAGMQTFAASTACLAVAMLTLVPSLLTFGTGLAESLSVLSLGLFFWARFQLNPDWSPLLLFALGVGFLAVEMLLVPGLGKPFVLGAICLSAAILKAYPDYHQGLQALMVAYAALGGGLWWALKVLPRHIGGRIALKAPTAAETAFDPAAWLRPYLGCQGEVVTALKPSGKVLLGTDVVSARVTKGFLEVGRPIRVVDVEANQVLVEPLEA